MRAGPSLQGAGIGGSNATCIELGPKAGGLTLASRGAQKPGYQPFGKATAVQFWLKDKNGSSTIPDLSVRPPFTLDPDCCTKDGPDAVLHGFTLRNMRRSGRREKLGRTLPGLIVLLNRSSATAQLSHCHQAGLLLCCIWPLTR